jgi:hypothetical protein
VTLAPYALAAGTGDLSAIAVDHNYPTLDNLTVQTATGVPVVGATIRAFLQVDYDAGLRTAAYVKGSTVTDSSGHWLTPIMLDPATYTLLIYKLGETLTTVVPLTVTAHV